MKSMTRRLFAKTYGLGLLSIPLVKSLESEIALGMPNKPKLFIITHPEGHDAGRFEQTRSLLMNSELRNRSLFLEGVRLSSNGITHGAEQAILRANTPNSLDSYLEKEHGFRVSRLGLAVNTSNPSGLVCHNEQGSPARISSSPMELFETSFGIRTSSLNSSTRYDLRQNRRTLVDVFLKDIQSIRRELGSLASLYDDYTYSLHELNKKIAASETPSQNKITCESVNPPNIAEANFGEILDASLELSFQLFNCNASDVIVMQLAHSESSMAYNFVGGPVDDPTGFHGAVIHGQGKSPTYHSVIDWYFSKVFGFAEKLAASSVSDSSLIFHTSNAGDPQAHSLDNVPMTLIGNLNNKIKTGARLDLSGVSNHRVLATIIEAISSRTSGFGAATEPLAQLLV